MKLMNLDSNRRIAGIIGILAMGAAHMLSAATLYVTPGSSVQSTIDSASPGDTIVIFGGIYAEDITINKPLSIGRVQAQNVLLSGTVTVSGVQATGTNAMLLSYLSIGGDMSKSLQVNNSSGLLVLNCDVKNVNATRSKVTLQRCNVQGTVVATGSVSSDTNNVVSVLQCTVTNGMVRVANGFSRILYNDLFRAVLDSADSVVLGNRFNLKDGSEATVDLSSGKTSVKNNDITVSMSYGPWWSGPHNNAIRINNNETTVANNFIHDVASGSYDEDDDHNGVFVQANTKMVQIVGNLFWGTRRPVYGPSANVLYAFNDDVEGLNRHGGGVIAQNIISADPLFVNKTNADYHLSAGSACINAGPTDAWFNDRDGTRNDIGLFGGAAYDPEGKTTDKPITFLLQATPLTVIKGVHTNLSISGGGIVIGR